MSLIGEGPILHVEDDSDDVVFMRLAFERCAIQRPIVAVSDGARAIARIACVGDYADRALHPPPGAVLLDLKLPRVSGIEVLTWLHAQPAHAGLRVIVLSASSQPEDLAAARALGVDAFLTKPVSFEGLVGLAREIARIWGL